MISNFGCKLLLALFGWTTAILRPARAGPDFKLASITSSRKLFCSRAIRGHTSNIWSFQQHCQGDVLQQGQLGCKMRVRVTNFTSLVATVDFPLVLISGCVDNYSDQVDSSFFASSSEQCSAVEDQSITELKMWHHALRHQSPFFPCALDDTNCLTRFSSCSLLDTSDWMVFNILLITWSDPFARCQWSLFLESVENQPFGMVIKLQRQGV